MAVGPNVFFISIRCASFPVSTLKSHLQTVRGYRSPGRSRIRGVVRWSILIRSLHGLYRNPLVKDLYWSETVFIELVLNRAVLRRVLGFGLTKSDAVETRS